jgi:hypothetical protein
MECHEAAAPRRNGLVRRRRRVQPNWHRRGPALVYVGDDLATFARDDVDGRGHNVVLESAGEQRVAGDSFTWMRERGNLNVGGGQFALQASERSTGHPRFGEPCRDDPHELSPRVRTGIVLGAT